MAGQVVSAAKNRSEALAGRLEELRAMISILLRTSDYRGDHAAEVTIALEPVEGETVEALLTRARLARPNAGGAFHLDWIELRLPAQG